MQGLSWENLPTKLVKLNMILETALCTYIYPPSDELKNGAKLVPCNVFPQKLIEYSTIKFTGLVYSLASESDSLYQLPSGYFQTLLSKAQVSK
jgi:hypothetical protein